MQGFFPICKMNGILFSVGIRIWDFNLNLIFILLLLLILPNILLYNIFTFHENGQKTSQYYWIGLKKFLTSVIWKKLLAESFLSISLLHCFILLGIYFVYHPSLSIHFIPDDYLLFFKNPIIKILSLCSHCYSGVPRLLTSLYHFCICIHFLY